MRNIILFISMLLIALQSITAQPISSTEPCISLGPQPGFIIKFRHLTANLHEPVLLNKTTLQSLSKASNLQFVNSRVGVFGWYLALFTPESGATAMHEIRPGCYAKADIEKVMSDLRTRTDVESITPNLATSVSSIEPTIRAIGTKQWNLLNNNYGGINVTPAWTYTQGAGAVVAVLDTGVLPNLALNNNISSVAVTFNNNGATQTTGNAPSCTSCSGYNHGTHVSGIIAATGIEQYGDTVSGIAPAATVLMINVFTNVSGHLTSYTWDQVFALSWLLHGQEVFPDLPAPPTGVVAVSMSLGGYSTTCDPTGTGLDTLFQQLSNNNIVTIVAAGNGADGTGSPPVNASNITPANCPHALAIASTGPHGYRAWYSNYGTIVKVAAPGGDNTDPAYIASANEIYSTGNQGYFYDLGTSMAAPHVSGLVALLKAANPTLTSAQVLDLLQTTSTAFPTATPPSPMLSSQICGSSSPALGPCGAGIINPSVAVLQAYTSALQLSWTPGVTVTNITIATADVNWQAGSWSTGITVPILYTVKLNGQSVSACTNIISTSCNLTGLTPQTDYALTVSATDQHQILTPVQSPVVNFSTTAELVAPILTYSLRNPLDSTSAYLYYSNRGSAFVDINYSVNGLSSGATITLDAAHQRFIVRGITTPRAIAVSVGSAYQSYSATSNTITIPSILARSK